MKMGTKWKEPKTIFACSIGFLGMILLLGEIAGEAGSIKPTGGTVLLAEKKDVCVVIDAGHGGADPGKIGINGALEKDVNLEIAQLLKTYLEMEDVKVVMTRQTEEGLYDENASNKKVQDMKRRIARIEEVSPDLVVSIHQNSYPREDIKGAQVFYYSGSAKGEKLAGFLQESLRKRVDPENRRQMKPNDSYYMLKKTAAPIVIVECGFLSNREEAEKLCDKEYQQRVAWAIHMGILQCLNTLD